MPHPAPEGGGLGFASTVVLIAVGAYRVADSDEAENAFYLARRKRDIFWMYSAVVRGNVLI